MLSYPETRCTQDLEHWAGLAFPDPYRWLEAGASDEVRLWQREQARLASDYVRAWPHFGQLKRQVARFHQATSIGAEVLQLSGKLGCVVTDAYADLVAVDADPLKDISVLAQGGRKLSLIVRAREVVKNRLA